MDYKIVSAKEYKIFKQKIVESLKNNWKLHGHTQYPLEVIALSRDYLNTAKAMKGQYSQAMIKYND